MSRERTSTIEGFVTLLVWKRFSRGAVDRLGRRSRDNDPVEPPDRRLQSDISSDHEEVAAALRSNVNSLLIQTARAKTLESAVAKLRRSPFRLSQIADIGGCRITVPDLRRQDDATGFLLVLYPESRVVDHREKSQCGYRAVHVIVKTATGRLVEVQVRTRTQDTWANTSERLAGRFGIDVKYCGGPPAIRSALDLLSEDGRGLDQQLGGVVGILTRAAALDEQLRSIEQALGEAARADARFIEVESEIPPLETEMTELLVALRRAGGPHRGRSAP